MDTARDKKTKRIISGFDLKRLESVNKNGYECIVCGIPVNPVSFEKHHKRSPHFKLFPDTEHSPDCSYDKEQHSYIVAETVQISTPDGLPFPYPSRMVLSEDTTLNDQNAGNIKESHVKLRTKTDNSGRISSHPHNYTVDTIRPLAQFYLKFPFDRHLPLTVPGISGNNFSDIFQRIAFEDTRDYSEKKILFGSIHYRNTAVFEDFLEIYLTEGYWKENKPINQYRVRVHTKGWTELEKKALISEIDIIRSEIKEINDKNKKSNTKNKRCNKTLKGLLFFVAEQDRETEFLFHANNWRFICCIMGNFRQGSMPKINTVTKDNRIGEKTATVNISQSFTPPQHSSALNNSEHLPHNYFSLDSNDAIDPASQPVNSKIKRNLSESNNLRNRSISDTNQASRQKLTKPKQAKNSPTAKITKWVNNILKKLFS